MKTPDEIKKGLEVCRADECHGHHTGCPYDDDFFCIMHICGDAIAYIEHLENSANLNPLRDAIYEDAVAHGLWEDEDDYMPTDCVYFIKDEVNELDCAAIDWEDDIINDNSAFCDELADVIIMCLSVAGKLGIDIDDAVKRKMEINKRRTWKHGKEKEHETRKSV